MLCLCQDVVWFASFQYEHCSPEKNPDFAVGAIGVHAASGMWGLVAVGLFADGSLPGVYVEDGLFRGGGGRLLGLQILEIVAVTAWAAVCAAVMFHAMGASISQNVRNPRIGLRVPLEEEMCGADEYLHNVSTRKLFQANSLRELSVANADTANVPENDGSEVEGEGSSLEKHAAMEMLSEDGTFEC